MAFHVYRSNRTGLLVDELAGVVAAPLGVTSSEVIAVQSRGMERWVSMELARRLGVWANPTFPFPRKLLEDVMARVLGAGDGWQAFMRPNLGWSVARLIGSMAGRDSFGPVRDYVAGDVRRRIQLAHRIAHVFDQYAVTRPEMVLAWDRGEAEGWQPELWRALVEEHGPVHLAARVDAFLARWRDAGAPPGIPPRVSLFGISSLAPLYVRVLAGMAERMDVHLFLLSPSRGGRSAGGAHPLLESMGRQGRDLEQVLEAHDVIVHDAFEDPGGTTCLRALQSALLGGRPAAVRAGDGSIAVHSCHGPMREVEVLRDVLIDMFERDAELQPHDVLVMTPDMQAYAPFIEAVFGSVERGSPGYVPFRISDTGGPAGDDAASAFLALLGLLDGRMGASAVLDLVAMEAVRARFGIEDMDQVSRWVRESGVRWGVDGVHRREEGQDFDENTWRFGLDRLLLGHAMEGRDATLWASTLPHDDVEGGATADLGRLVDLLETLFGLRREAMSARTLGGWSIALGRMLDAMIDASGPRAREAGRIRRILEDLGDMEACFGEHVGLAVVRSEIERVVGESRSVHQFLAGGVTFCEMLPMRSIPVRVVCLLGMNDDAFPRTSRTPGFDLAAATRLPGDRSSREDDRYMFLEALLSARDALVVTYVGQSLRDSAAYPPSVVVSELLDVLDEGGRVVVRHPMQAFSPRYFSPSGGLVSYSEANARAAARLVRGRHGPVPFVTGPVEDPGWDGTVTLDDLVRFFSGPGRWFLQRRLGMYVDAAGDVTDDREPLVLDPLEGHALGARLLGHAVAGGRASDLHAAVRASGRLPPGSVGDVELDDRVPWAGAIARVRERHARGEPRVVPIDIEIGGTRLRGRLEGVRPGGLVTHDFGKLDARRELVLWIRHLVLCAASPGGRPPASVLVCRSADGGRVQATTLGPVDDALAHLGTLLGLLAQGRSAPLPFFPAASRRYAAELGGKGHEAALESAAGAFAGTRWQRGDGDDPYVAVAYRGTDPLADPFCEVAVRVWGPFLDHGRGGG